MLEGLMGVKKEGESLVIDPCIPRGWPGFDLRYRYGRTTYEISVQNRNGAGRGVTRITVDGVGVDAAAMRIALHDDGAQHRVSVVLG
jgi:cyclic beta-1,2-glucan synthetase